MVNRFSKTDSTNIQPIEVQADKNPCVVVDLDGTLLRGNSLHLMVRFMASKLRKRGGYGSLLKIALLLIKRRLGLISHIRMKQPLHYMATATLSDDDLKEFAGLLRQSLDTALAERLDEYRRQGYYLMLATAAPDLYLPQLAAALGFDGFIGTPLTDSPGTYRETRCERKRDLCLKMAAEENCEIKAVATDHSDDLPLLEMLGIRRLLVAPSPNLCKYLGKRGLEFEVLP